MKRFLSLILAFCIACSLCFASVLSASASTIVGYGEDELLEWSADFLLEKVQGNTDNLNGEYIVIAREEETFDSYKKIVIGGYFFSEDIEFSVVEGSNGIVTLSSTNGGFYFESMEYFLLTDNVSNSYYQYTNWGASYRNGVYFTFNTNTNKIVNFGQAENNIWFTSSNFEVGTGILKYWACKVVCGEYITHPEPTEPTDPPTTKPVDEEQLEVSNSILDNIKTVVTNIINLPAKIAEAIGGFFTTLAENLLNGLEFLFVPSDNLFEDLINLLHEKFEFVFQILEIGDFIIDYDFDDSPPDASVDFSGKKGLNWGSGKIQFINWEMIEPYRNLIKNLTLAIAWYFFIRKVQKRLPDIINGVSSGGTN
ncbi:MAG: hypothetical protein E7480_08350 [Ruminococcaceae bacterium]|nr:hypothetical protein [Oscillospiraceae bacterium]